MGTKQSQRKLDKRQESRYGIRIHIDKYENLTSKKNGLPKIPLPVDELRNTLELNPEWNSLFSVKNKSDYLLKMDYYMALADQSIQKKEYNTAQLCINHLREGINSFIFDDLKSSRKETITTQINELEKRCRNLKPPYETKPYNFSKNLDDKESRI